MKNLRSLSKQEYIDYASMSHNSEDVLEMLDEIKHKKDLERWVRKNYVAERNQYNKEYKAWAESVLPADQVEEYVDQEPAR